MKVHWRVFLFVAVFLLIATMSMAYERNETFVCSGGSWSTPSNWNPFLTWAAQTGTEGLVYEQLFHYYPVTGEFQPWLAKEGKWVSSNVYELELRKGIKWTDGEKFTADDVVYTFEVAKDNPLHYSNVWTWIDSVVAVTDNKVKFVFAENPHYQEWKQLLYQLSIIPEHIWKEVPSDKLMKIANENPVGTGSYIAHEVGADRMVWVRNDDWWGNEIFGTPTPKYLVDLIVYSNNVAMGMMMKGELDLNNNFTAGLPKIKDTLGWVTWYQDKPYLLPDNTALLFLNTQKGAFKDVNFRKALAYAINPETITEKVFENQCKVSNPAGLFGENWMEYYSEEVAENYGFHYDPEKAVEILDANGYVDVDGDGFREDKDGNEISYEIIVPNGWTDWMESIKIIADNLRDVGIKTNPGFPDYSIYEQKMHNGTFDMLINNFGSAVSPTPWTYWNWLLSDEIDGETVTDGNWGRYRDENLFDLIDQFNVLQEGTKESQAVAAEIQKGLLEAMPAIPLWYNGLWAQSSTNNWTNWPTEKNPEGLPCSWRGYWSMGAAEMLINLEPAN